MAAIQIFHISNIILADNSNFSFIGSIPEAMLRDVSASSEVLWAYRSFPLSGFHPLTDEMRKVLEDVEKCNKGGKKKGTKFGLSEPAPSPKKVGKRKPEAKPSAPTKAHNRKRAKKMARRARTLKPSDQEDSQSQTILDIPIQTEVYNEEEVTSQPEVLEPATMNLEVTTEFWTYIPINEEFFHDLFVPSPTTTISIPITISPCPPVSLGVRKSKSHCSLIPPPPPLPPLLILQ